MVSRNKKSSLALPVKPLLIVISGPSGVGKDATLAKMKEAGLTFSHIVTVTTRPKRAGEKDGLDYLFLSQEQFHKMVKRGQLLEWAKVYDSYYGVPKKAVRDALRKGEDVIVKVDVQGAATIKGILPDAVFIFLMPPTAGELTKRLKQRHGRLSVELKMRLDRVQEEINNLPLFDYVVVNHRDNLDLTVLQIEAIIKAEKCRVQQRMISL